MIGNDAVASENGYLEGLTIDMTPLLDIMFLLLIFFVLTANSVQHALQLDLPEKGSGQAMPLAKKDSLSVSLHETGAAWGIDDRRIERWEEFRAALLTTHATNPDLVVVVAGDRQVPMERLLQLLALLKGEGMKTAHILMEAGANTQEQETTPAARQ